MMYYVLAFRKNSLNSKKSEVTYRATELNWISTLRKICVTSGSSNETKNGTVTQQHAIRMSASAKVWYGDCMSTILSKLTCDSLQAFCRVLNRKCVVPGHVSIYILPENFENKFSQIYYILTYIFGLAVITVRSIGVVACSKYKLDCLMTTN